MILQNLPLFDYNNGTFMIIIFALVCVALVVALLSMINSGKKVDEDENQQDNFVNSDSNNTENEKE
ncbi:hypothetical protein GGR32_000264 [Mesonia hippocampi]|uniref:Uncharacterized protein n=1 Tax=Mesonia hippocampi TaxID=1628250 RepID=A0A840EFK8_9FLAO|nr:hypothetical protein [Mesonia hippocampi]MBB4117992.1 hypothetical protein [Mesonia hippocampi]